MFWVQYLLSFTLFFKNFIFSSWTPNSNLTGTRKRRDEENHTERHGNLSFAKTNVNSWGNICLQSTSGSTDVIFFLAFILPDEINEFPLINWVGFGTLFYVLVSKGYSVAAETMLHTIKIRFPLQELPQYWPWQLWVPLQGSHYPVSPMSPLWICLWLYAFYLSSLLWWSMQPSTTTPAAGNQTVLRRKSR